MSSSSPERLSQVERAVAQLADIVRSIELRTQKQLEEAREEARKAREEERKTREEERKAREERRAFYEKEAELERASREEARREWNRERGEIARKLGTVVEDIVAPSIPRVVASIYRLPEENPIEHFAIRVRRRAGTERHEFDAVAAWPGYFLINETRSVLRSEDVPALAEKIRTARRFFPEYADRKLVAALATLYPDDSLVRFVERQGFIIMGLGDDLMEAKNSPGFRPTEL